MITSGAVSAPLLPHHQRVKPPTHRNTRLCRGPGLRGLVPLFAARRGRPSPQCNSALPFPDDTFDALVCECAFRTFPDKTTAAAEFARVLRRALIGPEVSACKGRSEAERQKFLERSGRRPRSFGDPCGWRRAGPR
jgi:hypothetical protein